MHKTDLPELGLFCSSRKCCWSWKYLKFPYITGDNGGGFQNLFTLLQYFIGMSIFLLRGFLLEVTQIIMQLHI